MSHRGVVRDKSGDFGPLNVGNIHAFQSLLFHKIKRTGVFKISKIISVYETGPGSKYTKNSILTLHAFFVWHTSDKTTKSFVLNMLVDSITV